MTLTIDSLIVEGRSRGQRFVTDLRSQATANSTLTLTEADASIQVFTGTVAGQILQLPNATTLLVGQRYEIYNLSTQPVTIQNATPTALVQVSQSRRCFLILTDNGTAAGTWAFQNDAYGANFQYAENLVLATNTSQVTYNAHTTLTPTNPLPLGNYCLRGTVKVSTSGGNRMPQARVAQAGVELAHSNVETFITDIDQRESFSWALYLPNISGSPAFTVDFRVSPGAGGTTANCYESSLTLLRES